MKLRKVRKRINLNALSSICEEIIYTLSFTRRQLNKRKTSDSKIGISLMTIKNIITCFSANINIIKTIANSQNNKKEVNES